MARTPRVTDATLIRLYNELHSVKTVAEKCGYWDPNWVARRLRKHGIQLGMTGTRRGQSREFSPEQAQALAVVVDKFRQELLPNLEAPKDARVTYWVRRALIDLENLQQHVNRRVPKEEVETA